MNNNERKATIFADDLDGHGILYDGNIPSDLSATTSKNHAEQIQLTSDRCDEDIIVNTYSTFNSEEDTFVDFDCFSWDGEVGITRDYLKNMMHRAIDCCDTFQEGA